MNFLQLAQAVKRESGLGAGSSVVSFSTAAGDDLRMFNWVNWAARDITLMRADWRWRRGDATLASTTARANTPADFGVSDFASWVPASREYKPSARRVSETNERSLEWLPFEQYRQIFVVGAPAAGGPQYWSVSPTEQFLVGPGPDEALFIRADYVRDYIDLAADADTPLIPTRFHTLIVWRALMEYGGFDAASEVLQRADRNYGMGMAQMLLAGTEMPSFTNRPL